MTKEEAIQVLREMKNLTYVATDSRCSALDMAIESLSTDSVRFEIYRDLYGKYIELKHKTEWRKRKPTEDGAYMVTLDAFGNHRFVKLMDYGKPLLPTKDVGGKCWYRSDDEWGDVIYDDDEILAWMPLPKPYEERREP